MAVKKLLRRVLVFLKECLPPPGKVMYIGGSDTLPAITAPEDAWLLPLKAQQNGFFSASFTTAAQSAAAADQLVLHYQQAADPKAVAKQFGRLVKHKLKK